MNRLHIIVAALAACPAGISRGSEQASHLDPPDDARLRRTEPGAIADIASAVLPDILGVTFSGWESATAAADPYHGTPVDGSGADLFRLDLVIAGMVCPPGTLGMGGRPYLPNEYGQNPLFGHIEIDLDNSINTGGEFGGAAANRFLGNVGRFGLLPSGPIAARAARSGSDLDLDFNTGPQFERSGADFSLTMCGCFHTEIVQRITGDADDAFEPGEVWVVRGRFFQRAGGYQQASSAFGGSALGMYDPMVNLRFAHDDATDETTISLVYPLTMRGAATLAGQTLQNPDSSVLNHTSVFEALQDIIFAANFGSLSGATLTLTSEWAGADASAFLDPTRWSVTALLGTAYASSQETLYAWTDVLGAAVFADFNGDGVHSLADRDLFRQALQTLDGGPADCDGAPNGVLTLCTPGSDWSVFDLNNDGRVDHYDLALVLPPCVGDTNGDRAVDFHDLDYVLAHYGAEAAFGDFNADGVVDFLDLNILLGVFGSACPQ